MATEDWQLHARLAADTHYLGALSSAHLLLHRDAALHWLILVPETGVTDLLDLSPTELSALMGDAAMVSGVLKEEFAYPRVNVGALGLVVPQLHLHVVGRKENDPCWPAPVWGNLATDARYTESELKDLRSAFGFS